MRTITAIRKGIYGSRAAYAAYNLALDFKKNQYRQLRTRTNLIATADRTSLTPNWATIATGSVTGAKTASLPVAGDGVYVSGSIPDSATVTVSCLLSGTGTVGLSVIDGGSADFLSSGTPAIVLTTTPTRYSWTRTIPTGNSLARIAVRASNSSGVSVTIDQAQIELGATASAFISGAPVTENVLVTTPVRANLLFASNDLTQAAWTKADTTISPASGVVAPSGDTLALLTEGTAGTAVVFQSLNLPAFGSAVTASLEMVRGSHDWARIVVGNSTASNVLNVWVNLSTGAIGTNTSSGTITLLSTATASLGSGVYRFSISYKLADTDNTGSFKTVSASGDNSITRVNNGTRYQGRHQFEISAAATTYIPNASTSLAALAGGIADLYGFSYTRSGARGIVNSDGTITYFPANVPCITSQDGYTSYPSLTNLLLQSQAFDNASWGKSNVAVTANQVTAPDGTLTADLATISSALHNVFQNVAVVASTIYTFSFFVQRGTATDLKYSVFDVTHSADIIASTSYFSQTGASGWARISVTFTTPAGCTSVNAYSLRDGGVTGTVYLWQAQLVAGSQAAPIILTTTSAATVGADAMVFTSSLPTGDFTFIADGTAPAQDGNHHVMAALDTTTGSFNNLIELDRSTNAAQRVSADTSTGTALYNYTGLTNSEAAGIELRLAAIRNTGSISAYADGAVQGSPVAHTYNGIVNVTPGRRSPDGAQFASTVSKVLLINSALTASQIGAA